MGQAKSACGADVACQSVASAFLKGTEGTLWSSADTRESFLGEEALVLGCKEGKALLGRKPREGDGYTCWNRRNHGARAPRLLPTFPLMRPCLHSQSRHKGISSICPQVAGGGATCPANLQTKSIGGKIAQVRFHPWSLRAGQLMQQPHRGKGEEETMGTKRG